MIASWKSVQFSYEIWLVAFSPDSKTLASAGGCTNAARSCVKLWDVETAKNTSTLEGASSGKPPRGSLFDGVQ
jgi:WD40 repeat protein